MQLRGGAFDLFLVLVLAVASCLSCSPSWDGGSARFLAGPYRQHVVLAKAATDIYFPGVTTSQPSSGYEVTGQVTKKELWDSTSTY